MQFSASGFFVSSRREYILSIILTINFSNLAQKNRANKLKVKKEKDTVLKKCVSSKVLIFVVNKKINKEQ